MAITNGYVTLDELKSYMGIGDTNDDTELEVAAEAASRAIDRFCRRFFYSDTQTRYYSASDRIGTRGLRVDDLVSVTTLKTDAASDGTFENTWTSDDYWLTPHNANTDGRPYTCVERRPTGSFAWPSGPRSVEIAGTWGWPAVPTDIKQATAIQATRLFKRAMEAPFGVAGVSFDGGGIRLLNRLDADVEMLVSPFRQIAVR